jgi:hypothetical protein
MEGVKGKNQRWQMIYLEKIKRHPKYSDYGCDHDGNIYSFKSKNILRLKPSLVGGNGPSSRYKYVNIDPTKCIYVHRVVAETLIPTANSNKLQVDHEDGDRCNNAVSNLSWVTRRQNKENNSCLGITRAGKSWKGQVNEITLSGSRIVHTIYEKSFEKAYEMRVDLVLKYYTHNHVNKMMKDIESKGVFFFIHKLATNGYNINPKHIPNLMP